MPCISSVAPWQPWLFRDPNVAPPDTQPLEWSYHFFWGLEDIISVFRDMWSQVENNQTSGSSCPNDGDGLAWSARRSGSRRALGTGYTIVDPGRYENLSAGLLEPDRGLQRWRASRSSPASRSRPTSRTSGRRPASRASSRRSPRSARRSCSRPRSTPSGPDLGEGLSVGGVVEPDAPVHVVAHGQSAPGARGRLHRRRPAGSGRSRSASCMRSSRSRATPSRGPRASTTRRRIRDAIKATDLDTIVGHVAWDGTGLPPFAAANIAKTPLVGGQWVQGHRTTSRTSSSS